MYKRYRSHEETPLLPADLNDIVEKYKHIFTVYSDIPDKHSIYPEVKRTPNKLSVLFPLKEHPIHGKTGLLATEKYDNEGFVTEYHYQWKLLIPKKGVHLSQVTAWENEAHSYPKYQTASEPHHHHHDPGDRSKRKENWDVRTLDEILGFIEKYIVSKREYMP